MNAPFIMPHEGVFLGDAVSLLATMPASFVDMAYADPPFGNKLVWKGRAGQFDDRWQTTDASQAGWEALRSHNPGGARLVDLIPKNDHERGYLGFMAGLLVAVWRALKPTGTLWLHFDDTMGAQLRVLADMVFQRGSGAGIGLVLWKRTTAHSSCLRSFGRVHDTIAIYARTRAACWRLHRSGPSDLVSGDPTRQQLRVDGFCEDRLNSRSGERVGYPTQKPVALLARFITAATLPGDLVLDPTCGSGTTLVAARNTGRRYLGLDVSPDAVATASRRLVSA